MEELSEQLPNVEPVLKDKLLDLILFKGSAQQLVAEHLFLLLMGCAKPL